MTAGDRTNRPPLPRLRMADLPALGTVGLRSRRLRAALSALGIVIGIAAMVSVLGIARSSSADLIAQLDQLGTNLLTVANGQDLAGREIELPTTGPAMIGRVAGVEHVAATALLPAVQVYRSDQVPAYESAGLDVRAADASLPASVDARMLHGVFLNAASERLPVTVLGYQAARALGIPDLATPARVFIGGRWFAVAGILQPLPLARELDRSALIGFPSAHAYFAQDGHPGRIYVRTLTEQTVAVAGLLAATTQPSQPEAVDVSRPSDVLAARVAAINSSTGLYLALGAVALLVGAVGIANVMVVAVIERRGEIGLRRALGAARRHVAAQFLTESLLLAVLGGLGGVIVGGAVTGAVAASHHWQILIPAQAVCGGLLAAPLIGTLAGLYPALRAAWLSPTDALRTG